MLDRVDICKAHCLPSVNGIAAAVNENLAGQVERRRQAVAPQLAGAGRL